MVEAQRFTKACGEAGVPGERRRSLPDDAQKVPEMELFRLSLIPGVLGADWAAKQMCGSILSTAALCPLPMQTLQALETLFSVAFLYHRLDPCENTRPGNTSWVTCPKLLPP